ncbi:MAG: malonyl-CoA decarboxylase family protein, partial [Pseudomonadota bacterium]
MSGQSFFQGLLSSVFERGISFSRQSDNRPILELAEALVSERGEVSGTKIAHALLTKYQTLSAEERETFLLEINDAFDVDATDVMHAAENYARDQSAPNLKRLQEVAEPRRLELLRRLNAAPGGTQSLVRMREDILALVRKHNQLKRTDVDFEHLFSSWFNRGFLVMRPIDWQTPAHILEKIITYEAVHAIDSWNDLRRRLLPEDRRCFAFFHPAMPDEPLIFVEVALTNKIESSIQEVLAEERTIIADTEATTAVFYSISNCQQGLKGVSFGNMLIKQVADDLSHSLPNLKTFVTLSPVPGFMSWLKEEADRDSASKAKEALDYIACSRCAAD